MKKKMATLALSTCLSFGAYAGNVDIKRQQNDLKSINSSIDLTRTKIKSAKEIAFLPDLYFMLAELLVDKARISYSIKREANPSTPVEELDFTAERQIRMEAVETYRLIEERYPNFPSLDKVMFTHGLELVQLNDVDGAMRVFKRLTEQMPKSSFYSKALIEIGNIFFDKKDFEFALEQYKKVVALNQQAERREFAYYKMGWCYIHGGNFLEAMKSFDRVFALMKNKIVDDSDDIREEALLASVWPISELTIENVQGQKKFLNVMDYYRSVSHDKAVFRRVLERLSKRMELKTRKHEAHQIYLELFRVSDIPSERLQSVEKFYLLGKDLKIDYYPAWVSKEIATTLWQTKKMDATRKTAQKELPKYEEFFRDFVTSLHKNAMATKRGDDLKDVVAAYELYIWIYPRSKYKGEIYLNMAEASYHAQDFVKAAEFYKNSSILSKDPAKKKEYLKSSLDASAAAFANFDKLTSLEKIQGRASFQTSAFQFEKKYPKDKDLPSVKFNLAKSYYDEQNFERAVSLFRDFVKNNADHSLVEQAAILLVDSFNIRDDLKSMAKEAKALSANTKLPPALRTKMAEVVTQAQLKKVRSIAGEMGTKEYADKFLQFTQNAGDSSLGEPALFEAFSAMKSSNDPRIFKTGEQYLGKFSENPRAKTVLFDMIQRAVFAVDYRQAVKYILAYGQKYPRDSATRELLTQAAQISEQLGDSSEAAEGYKMLGDSQKAGAVLARATSWNDLVKLSSGIPGVMGLYYQGLGLYRVGKVSEGISLLRRAAEGNANTEEEKIATAHAAVIVAENELDQFQRIGQGTPFSVALLQEKVQKYQFIDAQLNSVISSGAGKWVIAGLMNRGAMNNSFANFLANSKPPAGINPQQFAQMVGPQIAKYKQEGQAAFQQCLQLAESYEVFTKYTDSCRAGGSTVIREYQDAIPRMKAGHSSSEEWNRLKVELVKTPRNIGLLHKAFNTSIQAQDYAYAQAIAKRMIEIEPSEGQHYANLGVCNLYMGDIEAAQQAFSESLQKDSANYTALSGMAGLYKKYSFQKKYAEAAQKLKSAKPKGGLRHPLMLGN